MRQKLVRAYVAPELAEEVTRRAQAQGRSNSSLVGDIIRGSFAGTSEQAKQAETETVKRQLNRLEARLDKLIWEQLQAKECLLLFIRVWLEHNPPLDAELEDSAAVSAEARFDRFLDLLSSTLTTHPPRDLGERLVETTRNGALEASAST
jgi:hypothetical protein